MNDVFMTAVENGTESSLRARTTGEVIEKVDGKALFLNDNGVGNKSFYATRFAKVVELVITAMDISICFADFPTQKIGENTRAFRQLGIGYANLAT